MGFLIKLSRCPPLEGAHMKYAVTGGKTKVTDSPSSFYGTEAFLRFLHTQKFTRQEEKNMYDKVSTDMNFVEREKKTEKFWADNQIFEKSIESRKQGPTYTFYDGPPTANGKPHIGHVLTRVIKDMIPRYRTMKDIWFRERPAGIPTDFR